MRKILAWASQNTIVFAPQVAKLKIPMPLIAASCQGTLYLSFTESSFWLAQGASRMGWPTCAAGHTSFFPSFSSLIFSSFAIFCTFIYSLKYFRFLLYIYIYIYIYYKKHFKKYIWKMLNKYLKCQSRICKMLNVYRKNVDRVWKNDEFFIMHIKILIKHFNKYLKKVLEMLKCI